jgi:glycosyltransferase involved in cell wall biosynthesis
MDVTIAIPTYKNNDTTIRYLLDALLKQSYKKFRVLIVYKPSEGDNTEEIISKYKDLDLNIVYQEEGYFDEAMNLIFSNADSDILITTDDDAIPSKDWIKDHVEKHENFPEVGVVGSYCGNSIKTNIFKKIYSFFMERPLDEQMKDYLTYFSNTGIFVSNPFFKNYKSKYIKSFSCIGVNMSIKKDVYKDFRLLPMTLRGIGNEPYLCFHAFRKSMHPAVFKDCCNLFHNDRNSLSRPKTTSGIKERYAELMLSVYYLNRFYKLNFTKLKIDIGIKSLAWNTHKKTKEDEAMLEGIKLGLRLSLEAIQNNYNEKWIRNKLKNIQ